MKSNYVFTYGTLLKGERNHYNYLSDEDFICDGFIDGFVMFNLGRYPGIYEGEGLVLGELYLVDEKTLAKLDYLEEEGSLYIRKTTKVYSSNKTYEAFVYIYNLHEDNPTYLGDGLYSWKKLNKENINELIELGLPSDSINKYFKQ